MGANDGNGYQRYSRLISFFILFSVYALFHTSRKPLTISRTKINMTHIKMPNLSERLQNLEISPFVVIDGAYNFTYALMMLFSGQIIAKSNMKLALGLLSIICGLMTILFGVLGLMKIYSIAIWVFLSILFGVFQSFAFPLVVSLFKKIFDAQNSFTVLILLWSISVPFGNMIGTFVSSITVNYSWEYPSIFCGAILLSSFFLISMLPTIYENLVAADDMGKDIKQKRNKQRVTWMTLLKAENVIAFGTIGFITKMNLFMLFYWLPSYLISNMNNTPVFHLYLLSNLVDIGGIVGIIVAACFIKRGADHSQILTISSIGSVIAILSLVIAHIKKWKLASLFFIGMTLFPLLQTLITSTIANIQARHFKHNKEAFAGLASIMDAFGNFGAFFGPFIYGIIHRQSWKMAFLIMLFTQMLACCLLLIVNARKPQEYSFLEGFSEKQFVENY